MSSKHFHDDPAHLVASALKATVRTNPALAVDTKHKIVYIKQTRSPQVSVISGGGSGHEPSFAGLVGHGLLSGAVAGSIFASPSAEQIERCIMQCVDKSKGVMVIVMNYTGDSLHFGMAVEKSRARGVKVDMLIMGDDVGVGRRRGGRIGRRGIAGTVLVHKIAGALAAKGASLDEVSKVASLAAANLVSVGASLAHVHVPGRALAPDDFNSSKDIELGMGIHNEEGFKRLETDLSSLVKQMLNQLLSSEDPDRGYIKIQPSDSIALLINNLGGVSVLEIGCITEEICTQLEVDYKLLPARVYSGTFMSSLNGLGFSISILKLNETGLGAGKSMLELLDSAAEASGWSASIQPQTWTTKVNDIEELTSVAQIAEEEHASNWTLSTSESVKLLKSGLNRLIAAEPDVTKFDTMVGDGDCGLCLKAGADAVLTTLQTPELPQDALQLVSQIAHVVESNMDGTSGAIYAIFLNALASGLSKQNPTTPTKVTLPAWATALKEALASLSKYTPARPGDRTLVDALQPFVETLAEKGNLEEATRAARKGCESTKGMEASLGRSVYVGGESWKSCPDPGAYGLVEFLEGLNDAYRLG